MTEDDETPEFLREEKKRDPLEFAQKYMDKLEQFFPEGGQSPFARALPPPQPVTLPITIQAIQNGYLVHYGREGNPDTFYCPGAAEVLSKVQEIAAVFMMSPQGRPSRGPQALGAAESPLRTPPPGGKRVQGAPPVAEEGFPEGESTPL